MEIEVWKDVVGFEGLYIISDKGCVIKLSNGRVLTKINNGNGYIRIQLIKGKQTPRRYLHRLIAQAFIPNPESKRCINHINGRPSDNRIENLEWCTHSENEYHGYHVLGRISGLKGMTGEKSKCSVPVLQFDMDGNFIKGYPGLCEAERQTGIGHTNIVGVCKGKCKHAKGFIWRYKSDAPIYSL